jgi:hypothetical protein
MKNLYALIFLFFTLSLNAQTSVKQYKGVVAANFNSHYSGNGVGFSLAADYFLSRDFFLEGSFLFNRNKVGFSESKQYLFEANACYNFYQFKNFYAFGMSGLSLGMEKATSTVEPLVVDGFVFFYNLGAQIRYYYANYGLYFAAHEYFGRSKLGNYFFQPSIGVVYLFNASAIQKKNRKI